MTPPVPCAWCQGTDYATPTPPFRLAGYTEVRGKRYHFACEQQASEAGWFWRTKRRSSPEKPRVTSRAKKP